MVVSLRQCGSARRWIAEPFFCLGAGVGSGQPVALLDELQDIVRRYAGWDFGKGRSLLGATWRHGRAN
jgi:hypothetical protein